MKGQTRKPHGSLWMTWSMHQNSDAPSTTNTPETRPAITPQHAEARQVQSNTISPLSFLYLNFLISVSSLNFFSLFHSEHALLFKNIVYISFFFPPPPPCQASASISSSSTLPPSPSSMKESSSHSSRSLAASTSPIPIPGM